MPEPRIYVPFRISGTGFDWIEELARTYGVHRSTVIRLALGVARRHEADLIARLKEEQ